MNAKRWLMWLGVAAVLLLVAQWPVTTSVGLNYTVTTTRLPLYEKAINFISRDLQTRWITRQIVAGSTTDEEKLERLFEWVTQHVQPTPAGLPIIDDHPLHILIRGYGAEDQRTEAFLLLAGYTGFPGVIVRLRPPAASRQLLVALVRVGSRTLVFDIVNHVTFRHDAGAFADVQELLSRPDLMERSAPRLMVDGLPYSRYLPELAHLNGGFSRIASQQMGPRIAQELRRLVAPWHQHSESRAR